MQTYNRDQQALNHGHRRAAQRAADHDLQARYRCNERLFEKAELAIPQEAEAGEDGREQHRHADYAGGDELQIVAIAGALETRVRDRSRAPADTAAGWPSDAMICARERV